MSSTSYLRGTENTFLLTLFIGTEKNKTQNHVGGKKKTCILLFLLLKFVAPALLAGNSLSNSATITSVFSIH